MTLPLRLLMVEDSPDDAELTLRELRLAGYEPAWRRVQSAAAMKAALTGSPWDLVISDYVLPSFSAPAALALVQASGLDLPFIIVSGAIGEETAVQAMRAGAHDYIMKNNLARLAPAIVRELREAESRCERKQLEEQVRHAQRLEAVGRLAGGVAHDFSNLLTVIGNRGHLLLRHPGNRQLARREMTLILDAVKKAGALTQQLLLFSRGQLLPTRALSLNAVVADMEPMLRRVIGERIALSTSLDPALGHVMADPAHSEQVVMNLIVNACDAMPDGGRLTIETANVMIDEAFCRARVDARPGPHVMLGVTDTGVGMDAAVQAHLFDPFFTTKGARGTGLGLSVVYGIVKQGGGFISVVSAPGRGASFKIYLPRVDAPDQATEPPSVQPEATGGSETILLVEDETDVRMALAETLRGFGYTVLEAGDGDDALAVAAQHRARIHLLVTDVVMPRMSGPDLVRSLTAQRPEVRVLYVSGYRDDSIEAILDVPLLEKPFTSPVLARKVREVLNTPAKGAW
jgi:two-component system, cell cycle sensor histidine kinase and response regulator CckA